MKIRYAATVALSLLGAGLVAAPAALAADDAPPTLHSITFSRQAVTVRGIETKLLGISVHLSDPDGVIYADGPEETTTPAILIGSETLTLELVKGTPQDGVWFTATAVTATWSGDYRVELIDATDSAHNHLRADPAKLIDDAPTLKVTSIGAPQVRMTWTPNPANPNQALTQRVVVTDRDTGRPMANVPLVVEEDNICVESQPRTPNAHTDASGVWSRALPAGYMYDVVHCAWITGDNVPGQPITKIAPVGGSPTYRYAVTAKPAATSAPAGSNVAVTGTVQPHAEGKGIELQRQYAADDWRTVNRATVKQDATFRLTATPAGTATYSYRVFSPATDYVVAGYSPVFTIRGT